MNYKLNYMCLKRGVSLILGHGVLAYIVHWRLCNYVLHKFTTNSEKLSAQFSHEKLFHTADVFIRIVHSNCYSILAFPSFLCIRIQLLMIRKTSVQFRLS